MDSSVPELPNQREADTLQENISTVTASHVEFSFRDVYLTRADMRRMATIALRNQALYKGQEVVYLGTRFTVKSIFANGRRVKAGVFTDSTKPIFRSETARIVLYIQMAREMQEFETTHSGVIIFDKLINTFLPELFRRWTELKARHLVSVVLFTRMEYDSEPLARQPKDGSVQFTSNPNTVRDFYRVVVSHMPSGDGTAILSQLKKEYRVFWRDISIRSTNFHYDPPTGNFYQTDQYHDITSGKPSLARHGNLLEAINLVALQLSQEHVDRDLVRTGLSVMIISPGTGYFEVQENLLRMTTENLVTNNFGISLVCLSPRPLHSVPLFQYHPAAYEAKLAEESTKPLDVHSSPLRQNPVTYSMKRWAASHTMDENNIHVIPHWLETHHYRDPQDPIYKRDAWVPTSRLYEFMMSGIMEIEQADVSIPYLHETHPQFTGIGTGRPAAMHTDETGAANAGEGEHGAHGVVTNDKNETLDWMDEYDAQVFGGTLVPSVKDPEPPRHSAPHASDMKRAVVVDAPRLEKAATASSTVDVPTGIEPQSRIGRRIRDVSTDTANRLTPRPSKDILDIEGGAPSASAPRRIGSRPFLLGDRGVSFLKASATTAANYQSHNITTVSPTDSLGTKHIEHKDMEAPATATRDINLAFRGGSISSAQRPESPVATPLRSQVRAIMETGLSSRQRDSPHARRTTGTGSPSQPSPWYTIVNPSAPQASDFDASYYRRRWQHLYALSPETVFVNWKSLCTPASLPLTTGYFPTQEELRRDYEESSHKIAVDDADFDDIQEARMNLMRELLDFRLSKGFQVVQDTEFNVPVVGRFVASKTVKLLDSATLGEDGTTIFLSKGDTIHILCAIASEVQVIRYQRRVMALSSRDAGQLPFSVAYKPFLRTAFAPTYEQQDLTLSTLHDNENWSAIDQYLAGWDRGEYAENLHFWRARFVIIPVEPSKTSHRPNAVLAGDTDDEIHVEGIQKLTQIWDKNRYIPPGERAPHAEGRILDPNPLGLEFQTRDASAVVSAGLEDSLLGGDHLHPSTRIFSEPFVFKAADIDLQKLAHAIQGEEGIKMKDRRWFLTLHLNCFLGADLTSWLLLNVKDVTTREQAVDLGQRLMDSGLFHHVDKKHPFRDGNYFFAISSEYLELRSDSRANWLFRKSDKSVPSTPANDAANEGHTPEKPRQRTGRDSHKPESETNTPDRGTATKQTRVKLSAVMDYNVGVRKGSNRPEVVKLHYDRLYNPEACHHVRLEWLDANPKLIEDSITLWTNTAEKYGLKLVQVPIAEMRTISELNPFRSPYKITLSVPPPSSGPEHYFDSSSLGPQTSKQRHSYQRALLKHFNFVLDQEAASNFPADIAVSYSWGPNEYRMTQYIHRSGTVMAQVDDDGTLVVVANRLLHSRAATLLGGPSKAVVAVAEPVVLEMEAVCADAEWLKGFWEECAGGRESSKSTPMLLPSAKSTPVMLPSVGELPVLDG